MTTPIFKNKTHKNAEKRQKRLMENRDKWKLEQEKMRKLQDEFLAKSKG